VLRRRFVRHLEECSYSKGASIFANAAVASNVMRLFCFDVTCNSSECDHRL
jgi:hypothetical protein